MLREFLFFFGERSYAHLDYVRLCFIFTYSYIHTCYCMYTISVSFGTSHTYRIPSPTGILMKWRNVKSSVLSAQAIPYKTRRGAPEVVWGSGNEEQESGKGKTRNPDWSRTPWCLKHPWERPLMNNRLTSTPNDDPPMRTTRRSKRGMKAIYPSLSSLRAPRTPADPTWTQIACLS